jgi:hypothetical protein
MARLRLRHLLLCALIASQPALGQAPDPANPSCPLAPDWSSNRAMTFRVQERPGERPVLVGEGAIDEGVLPRLRAALADFRGSEIWLRSPGGDAGAGNEAGMLIRENGLTTRIPAGWTCAGACAFMFMGGMVRDVEAGGVYMLQMFTFTGNREAIHREFARGDQASADLLTNIARRSARLATDDNAYLIRMGISRALLTDIVYRQRAVTTAAGGPTRRCLTDAELRHYNVVNDLGRVH